MRKTRKNISRKQIPTDQQKPAQGLTDELVQQFCELVAEGMPMDGACDYLGIHSSTFWAWMRRGQHYCDDPENSNPEDKIYGDFVKTCKRATAEYRLWLLRRIHNSKDWKRELSILERRDRQNFGRFDLSGGTPFEVLDADERFF